MKKLLMLLAVTSVPCMANANCFKELSHRMATSPLFAELAGLSDVEIREMLEIDATVEKHLTRDAYQLVAPDGKILATIDGDVWRNQNKIERDGIITILG